MRDGVWAARSGVPLMVSLAELQMQAQVPTLEQAELPAESIVRCEMSLTACVPSITVSAGARPRRGGARGAARGESARLLARISWARARCEETLGSSEGSISPRRVPRAAEGGTAACAAASGAAAARPRGVPHDRHPARRRDGGPPDTRAPSAGGAGSAAAHVRCWPAVRARGVAVRASTDERRPCGQRWPQSLRDGLGNCSRFCPFDRQDGAAVCWRHGRGRGSACDGRRRQA